MKKLFAILIGIGVGAITLFSCSEENDPAQTSVIFEEGINSVATVDALFEDVDDAADFGIESITSMGMKMAIHGHGNRFGDCATVTFDEVSSTTTIDFGEEGCLGRDGRLRMGKLHLTHTGEYGQPGETRILTFEEFSVDSIGIEGVRTLENISDPESRDRIFTITLEGGKITFPDGTFVTRDAEKIRTVFFNTEVEAFQSTVFGIATGLNKDGLLYTHVIDESTPLLYTRGCREEHIVAPVSGILLIQVEGESDTTVDFGEGVCDNLVIVTQNGISEEIEIDPRERRRGHHRRR